MKRQSGFTLIELIIVIVILGILAVTAAPQFFNFGSDARTSTVRGMEGSVKAAADLVYARSAIEGIESEASETTEDGVDVAYGYPAATDDGILVALNLSEEDWTTQVAGEDIGGDANATDYVLFPSSEELSDFEDSDSACYVYYREAADEDTRPVIASETGGC